MDAQVPSETGGRRPEMEDWSNRYLFHPPAKLLARVFAPLGITPNMVSVMGLLCVVAAAVCYTTLPWPMAALTGFLCLIAWHIFDGADGDLARLTGKASFSGEFVDGVCDYTGQIILYVALAGSLSTELGIWAWVLATLAGGAHIAQTNFSETLRKSYLWLAYGKPWLQQATRGQNEALRRHNWFNFVFGWMLADYLQLAAAMTPQRNALDLAYEREAQDKVRLERFHATVRAHSRQILCYTPYLGLNIRTFMLGASMALGTPLWFFLGECIPLTIVLILAIRHRRRVTSHLAAQFQPHVA